MADALHSKQPDLVKLHGGEDGEMEEDCYKNTDRRITEIMSTLPKEKGWRTEHIVQYQGIWLTMDAVRRTILAQEHFNALPSDIFTVTFPKSGTTWIKALIFSIMNRARFEVSKHPLLISGPHDCVPFLEAVMNDKNHLSNQKNLSSPRLLSSHSPYCLLPISITNNGCRIVYFCRNPKDVFVSMWHFMNKLRSKELPPLSLGQAFEMFVNGVSHYGSYWDHVLGYWNASLESANEKVLFLHYEHMKRDPMVNMKRLAEFLGHPFSFSEENEGVVHEIIRLCSFENLRNLEVTKTGVKQFSHFSVENRDFFRKGQIGDWKSHLTPEMEECIDHITEQKFNGTGLMVGGMSPNQSLEHVQISELP